MRAFKRTDQLQAGDLVADPIGAGEPLRIATVQPGDYCAPDGTRYQRVTFKYPFAAVTRLAHINHEWEMAA